MTGSDPVCWAPSIFLFFLLPLRPGEKLGVSIYEKRVKRKKQDVLQIGDWKDNECLLEWII
jgi:hypothetical protein